ncbi:flagellar brake protein [Ferrovum myxofaciens]|jgi:c-di-GMP-binding flagellar brake protein YcgR|uniref:flagellar brake protein n=1 Tax=Ferrovum myxofaciens TaxID=416213 RepID=UPI000A047EA9|nr:flagellar brake protein [Ferrovum myxofaciens]
MSSKANISSEKVEPSMVMSSFASLNLQVGELLQAQVWAGQNSQKYSVRLIGYCERRSVLVTAPEFNGHVILAHEGQNIVMRYFSGKNAYAFTASVLRVCNTPYPYLHVTYPVSIQEMKIRKAARVKANVTTSVYRDDNPEIKLACTIADISFTGVQLGSTVSLGQVGDVLKLCIQVSSQGVTANISPSVVIKVASENKCQVGDGEEPLLFMYGAEFHNLDQTESFALQVLVYQNLLKGS